MLFYVLLRVVMAFAAYFGLAFLLAIIATPDASVILGRVPAQPPALDQPLASRFAAILAGQFGQSTLAAQPVSSLIGKSLGITLGAACLAALMASLLALPFGILAGRIQGSLGDRALLRLTLPLEAALPQWLSLLVIIVLALRLGIIPAQASQGAAAIVVPAMVLALVIMPVILRRTRLGVAEIAASGRGAAGGKIFLTCLSAILTGVVVAIGWAVAVEPSLATPGAGRLLYDGLLRRDTPVLAGGIMTLGAATIAIALLSDMLRAAAGSGGMRRGFAHELSQHGEATGGLRLLSAGFLVGVFVLVLLLGVSFAGGDPNSLSLVERLLPAGQGGHWLGTDELGRDILARLGSSLRSSIGIGLLIAAIATLLGALLGWIGTLSSATGTIVRNLIEARQSLPVLLPALALAAAISPGAVSLTIILGVGLWDGPAAATLAARYPAAQGWQAGLPPVPGQAPGNLLGPLLAAYFHTAALAILLLESFNALGLGLQPPAATFGLMLATAAQFASENPGLVYLPGLVLAALVLALLLIADGLRSASSRRTR